MRLFLPLALSLSVGFGSPASADPAPTPGEAAPAAQGTKVVAREGKGRLERTADGRHILYLRGTPYEMGYQHGKLLKAQVRKNMERITDNKGELGKETHYKLYKVGRSLMHARLRPHIPKRFKAEMKGLAAGAGIPYSTVEAGNLFPAAFHCSGMALMGRATHDGSLYHVRILDYFTKLGLQDSALIVVHQPEGYHAWMNVGFAGFIGSVTGMNDRQVSIGEMGGKGLMYWNGVPMAFLIRDALERASTLAETVKIFRTSKRTCEYYYVLGDGKTPDARGVWATPHKIEFFKPGQSYGFFEYAEPGKGAAGNKVFLKDTLLDRGPHHILLRSGDGKTKAYIGMPPKDCVVVSGFDRYKHFTRRLAKGYGKVDHKSLQTMIDRPVSMGSNLHNAIFHPKTLTAWVAVAHVDGSPACKQTYHEYRLRTGGAPAKKARPSATKTSR